MEGGKQKARGKGVNLKDASEIRIRCWDMTCSPDLTFTTECGRVVSVCVDDDVLCCDVYSQ